MRLRAVLERSDKDDACREDWDVEMYFDLAGYSGKSSSSLAGTGHTL